MEKPSDHLKRLHSNIGKSISKDKKLMINSFRRIKLAFVGLGIYFIGFGIWNLITDQVLNAVIFFLMIGFPIWAIHRYNKKGQMMIDMLQLQQERVEDIGKEIYGTQDDEKLT